MESTIAGFLDSVSSFVFWSAALCLLVLNGAALAAFVVTRSRRLVNEWTSRLVAADAVLLGAGLGVPLVAGLAKMGIRAVSAVFGGGAAPVE